MAASFTHGAVSAGWGGAGKHWLAGFCGKRSSTSQASHLQKAGLAMPAPTPTQSGPATKTRGREVQHIIFLQTAGSRGFKNLICIQTQLHREMRQEDPGS